MISSCMSWVLGDLSRGRVVISWNCPLMYGGATAPPPICLCGVVLICLIGFHGPVLLARFFAYNFYLHLYLSFKSMHTLSKFLLHIFLLSPFDKVWSQVFIIAVVTLTWVVQWLRLALSKGRNRVVVFNLSWGRKLIQFPKRCAFYILEYRTMDEVQQTK
jgi:hypothetical protein